MRRKLSLEFSLLTGHSSDFEQNLGEEKVKSRIFAFNWKFFGLRAEFGWGKENTCFLPLPRRPIRIAPPSLISNSLSTKMRKLQC